MFFIHCVNIGNWFSLFCFVPLLYLFGKTFQLYYFSNLLTLSVPDEGFYRNVLHTLNRISTFFSSLRIKKCMLILYFTFLDVTFSGFSSTCSVNDYAIATNKANDDGIHPMVSSGLVFDNVAKDNRILIHRPNVG